MTGTLYVVATPIGNLEDTTFRAVRVLKEVAAIACEDTRQTRKLLEHFGITTPLVSYHEHNEAERSVELVARLEEGDSIALVSDAGTPLVEDPGFRLVRLAAEKGLPVAPLPGASAPIAALSASGLPTDAFHFAGFLPPKSGRRRKAIEALSHLEATLVFFEAPHRILETLDEIAGILPTRPVVAAREITKIHEEFLRGTAAEVRASLAARPAIKGEFVLMIGKATGEAEATPDSLESIYDALIAAGTPRMDAIKEAARRAGLSKREAYELLERRPH